MKTKKISNKVISFILSFAIIFAYSSSITGLNIKAAANTINVVVDGTDKQISGGISEKTSALDALEETLNTKNIKYDIQDGQYGKFINSINNLKTNDIQKGSGWMYAIQKADGTYVSPDTAIDKTTLSAGDELLVYFSLWGTTYLANDIEFSTKDANKPITISVNNKDIDWNTNKPVVTPIEGITAKLTNEKGDTIPVTLDKNQISINNGLGAGNYYLDLSDYSANSIPKVAADKFEFTIATGTPSSNQGGNTQTGDNGTSNTDSLDVSSELKLTENLVKNYTDEWAALDLNNLGMQSSIHHDFIETAANNIKENGIQKSYNTEIEKLIIGLTAAGYTPYNFAGANLVSELYNRNIDDFLVNDAVYGLMAYEYANISDANYKITKNKLKDFILKSAIKDESGNVVGWSYDTSVKTADADMTGAVISALSPYYNSSDKDVVSAVDSAISHLNSIQDANGNVPGSYGNSSETDAFVILGLLAVNVNPYGATKLSNSTVDFKKANGNLVNALLSYKTSDGSYKHTLKDSDSNEFSTEEAFRALIALNEFNQKKAAYNYYSSGIDAYKLPVYSASENTTTGNSKDSNTNAGQSKISEAKVNKSYASLPQTGYFFDFKLLFVLGIVLVGSGACLMVIYRRKYVK